MEQKIIKNGIKKENKLMETTQNNFKCSDTFKCHSFYKQKHILTFRDQREEISI